LSMTCWLAVWGACHAEAAEMSNVARRALAADSIMVNYYEELYFHFPHISRDGEKGKREPE
jgi:hypothetical protein